MIVWLRGYHNVRRRDIIKALLINFIQELEKSYMLITFANYIKYNAVWFKHIFYMLWFLSFGIFFSSQKLQRLDSNFSFTHLFTFPLCLTFHRNCTKQLSHHFFHTAVKSVTQLKSSKGSKMI